MIAMTGQTRRAVMIELVLLAILVFVVVYSRTPNPVPATDRVLSPPLVAISVPVPTWNFSVVPDTKPAQAKAKVPRKIAKSASDNRPVPVQIVARPVRAAPEASPVPVAKEAIIPVTKPVEASAPETVPVVTEAPIVPEAAQVPSTLADVPVVEPASIAKEAQATPPEAQPVPIETLAMASETVSSPTPKSLPASVFAPAQTAPSEPVSPARSLVTGTTAALIFAPIAAPVSIIFGIAAALFTPTSSQLGQERPVPATPKKRAVRADPRSNPS